MWQKGWRDNVWSELDQPFDLIIIGGGITGAGILREAVRTGRRALLVEGNDFASGTSSRSSKLVHGGLRYLKNAQMKLTFDSVRERERLLKEGRGLVSPLGFLLASYRQDAIPAWMFGAGLILYDLLALKWGHRYYDASDLRELNPLLREEELTGGYRYFDAQTDDARLVLRLIQEAVKAGGTALNYACVTELLRDRQGQVRGIVLQDGSHQGRTLEIQGRVVINATGAWADQLRGQIGAKARLRKLRGSHLVFPSARLPLTRAVSFIHPRDGRPVFAFPWEGVTLIGTTDVDHRSELTQDPHLSSAEAEYLLQAAQFIFPGLALEMKDVQATFSGVRPVIGTGKADPSKESREHVLWWEQGMLTVAGGKLTTFRRMARDVLRAARPHLGPGLPSIEPASPDRILDPVLQELPFPESIPTTLRLRLMGRLGAQVQAFLADTPANELQPIPGTPVLWGELRWAARSEAVLSLEDLLLRRVRLGLLLPAGGASWMPKIQSIVQPELGWNDERWASEVCHYTNLWKRCYYLDTASS